MRVERLALPLLVALAACAPGDPPAPASADGDLAATAAPPDAASPPTEGNPMAHNVRPPAVAGSWYPADPQALAAEVDGYLKAPPSGLLPLALVAPHAGYRYSGSVAGAAFTQVRDQPVRRVWVLAPSHRLGLRGVGLYAVDAFRTPLGDLPVDSDTCGRLAQAAPARFSWLDRGDGGEHALEIELPFLQRALGAFELVPLLVGRLDAAALQDVAEAIRPELGPGDLVVVSSDFTHYGESFGYAPFGFPDDLLDRIATLDHEVWAHVANPDPDALQAVLERSGATVCGAGPLRLLAALLPAGSRGTEIRYTTSADLTGDRSHVVAYLAGRLDGPAWSGRGPQSGRARLVSPEAGTYLLDLARRSLEHWFAHGRLLETDPATVPADAQVVLGAFVTLEKHGQLRGCIGEITPQRPAWEAVVARAVDAAVRDPRFSPVSRAELPELELEVSLLGPSWQVPGSRDFIVGRHGIVLSQGFRRATFLPQVAPEQGWDRATTLQHLARKAGIPVQDLGRATVEVYEAQVITE